MLSYQHAFQQLRTSLQPLYDEREATAIAHEVMDEITASTKVERLFSKESFFTEKQYSDFTTYSGELSTGKPLQYVLGKAWFHGHQYIVNASVLIPRPETEELIDWIVEDFKNKNASVLDIGTGSGCIAIELCLRITKCQVTAIDISDAALKVAGQNAINLSVSPTFIQSDFLNESKWTDVASFDVIVSNPPYIPVADSPDLHVNVWKYEPGIALFVPDDALLFYRKIAMFGKEHLNKAGIVYCELHRDYALPAKNLFEQNGYKNVEIKRDMHGNLRMLKAIW